MFSRIVRPIARITHQGARRYHDDKPFKYASMDELPIPQGSWQADYDARQKKYNAILASGIIIFGLSFAYAKSTDVLNLHYLPPVPPNEKEQK